MIKAKGRLREEAELGPAAGGKAPVTKGRGVYHWTIALS